MARPVQPPAGDTALALLSGVSCTRERPFGAGRAFRGLPEVSLPDGQALPPSTGSASCSVRPPTSVCWTLKCRPRPWIWRRSQVHQAAGHVCWVPGTRMPTGARTPPQTRARPSRQDGALTTGAGRADLECDPRRVELGRGPRHRWRLGPDVGESRPPGGDVAQGGGQGAAVLVAGHDEVVDDEGGAQQQEDDARQGKPVHLPAGRTAAVTRGPAALTSHTARSVPCANQPAPPGTVGWWCQGPAAGGRHPHAHVHCGYSKGQRPGAPPESPGSQDTDAEGPHNPRGQRLPVPGHGVIHPDPHCSRAPEP